MFARNAKPDRPVRLRLPRWLLISASSAVLAVTFTVAGVGIGGTETASASFGICDPDTTLALPETPNALGAGANVSYTPGHANADTNSKPDDGYKFVYIDPVETNNLVNGYGGAGLNWKTYGTTCADFETKGMNMISNLLFSMIVLFPAKILGLLLQFAFSTTIANSLLDHATAVVQSLHTNIFLTWAPLVIMFVAIGAAWNFARQRGQAAFSSIGWTIGVIVVIAGLTTTQGLGLVKTANNAVGQMTMCATFSMTSGCANGAVTDTGAVYANQMAETLAGGIWGIGAIGDRSATPAPASFTFVKKNNSSGVFVADTWSINVPVNAIPAQNPGSPTYGEVWRWTQTYTNAEAAALNTYPLTYQCDGVEDQGLRSPSFNDMSSLTTSTLDKTRICSLKWVIRGAMLATLERDAKASFVTATGQDSQALTAAISGFGTGILAIGIAIMGAIVLFYQLELIGLVIISPMVALIALKNKPAAKKWGDQVVATLIKRISVGLALGFTLWMVTAIQAMLIGAVTGPGGVFVVNPMLIPIATALLSILAMIVGFALLNRIRDLLLTGMDLPSGDKAGGTVKKFAKTATLAAVSGGAGALAAGSGMRMMGAAKGLARSGAIGGSSVRRGIRAGEAAGNGVRRDHVSVAPAPDPQPAGSPSADADAGPIQTAQPLPGDANTWDALNREPGLRARQGERKAMAADELARVRDAVAAARADIRAAKEAAPSAIAGRTVELRALGMEAGEAQTQAQAEVVAEVKDLMDVLVRKEAEVAPAASAAAKLERQVSFEQVELHDRIQQGEDSQNIAEAMNFDPATAAALDRYLRTVTYPQPGYGN